MKTTSPIRYPLLFAILAVAIATIGCTPHIIPVKQGIVLLERDIKKLKVGLSRLEVVSVIGEPAISHNLTKNKWVYVYYSKTGDDHKYQLLDKGKNLIAKYVEITFANDLITEITYRLQPDAEEE